MFEIPEGLNPALVGLAWLRGRWEGTGYVQQPGSDKVECFQQIEFADNGGAFLHYICQTFTADADGRPVAPLAMEAGFWRPLEDGMVEVGMANPDGFVEIWYGTAQPARVDLITDAVVRTHAAAVPYTAGRRLYGLVDGSLLWSFERATSEHELQPHMWATLERA